MGGAPPRTPREPAASPQALPAQALPACVYMSPPLAPASHWLQHAHFAFVASPSGNGLDCHRTWEALLLRSIPIVKVQTNARPSNTH